MNLKTRFGQFQKIYLDRWQPGWSQKPELAALEQPLRSSLHAVEKLMSRAEELRASGKYSAQGLRDETRTLARRDTLPTLSMAQAAVELASQALAADRAKMTIPQADPADVAGAVRRGEMRSWFRTMGAAKAMQYLLSDDADDVMILAVMEGPAALSGLTEEMRGQVQGRFIEARHSGELARLEEMEEVITLTSAAIETARYQLRQEIGFAENEMPQFEAWAKSAA
jgi:hypothetical protein